MAGSAISLGIEVQGEETFKSALTAIDHQLKSMSAGIEAASASMETMGNDEEATAKKMDLLGKTLDANKQKLEILSQQYQTAESKLQELGKALEEAKKSGDPAAIDKATTAYNKQSTIVSDLSGKMSKTETEIAKTTKAMQSGGEAAQKEGEEFQKTGTISDELAEKISKMSNIMSMEFAAKAAKTVIDGLVAIAEKAVDLGKKIYECTTAVGTYADTMLTLSQTSHVDVVDLQKWEYAAQFIDTSVEDMTSSITKLTKNMASESAATTEAFQQLGVSVKDSSGNYKDAETVYWEVIDALGQVENVVERDNLAMTLLGKGATEMTPLIEAGSAAFKQLGDDAEAAGLIMSEDTVNAFGALDDASNQMQSTITAASRAMAAAFLPAVQELMGGATDVVQAFIGMVNGTQGAEKQFQSAVSNLVKNALKLLNDMLPKVLKVGVEVIKSLVKGVSENIKEITSTITSVVKEIIKVLTENLPDILSCGVDILMAIVDGIIDSIPTLVANLPKIIEAIITKMGELVTRIPQIGVNIVKGLWEGIKGTASWLWDKLTGWVNDVFGWLKGLFGIHSPSTLMRDRIGKMIGLGMAEGIIDSSKEVQRAFDTLMPDASRLAAAVDGYTVAARIAGETGDDSGIFQDNRPIIIELNDRELGRAVRGYA